jgi:hypothetical protein
METSQTPPLEGAQSVVSSHETTLQPTAQETTQTPPKIESTSIDDPNLGAPTRQWLNSKITPVLLKAVRWVAAER